jgi:outer membrane protease
LRSLPSVYTTGMRATSRLSVLTLCVMLLMAPARILAQDAARAKSGSGYELSMATGLGVLYGASLELVYKDSLSDSLLSELYWPMQPLAYWSSALFLERVAYGPRFFASFGLDSGFYSYTGTMTDKDWTTSSSQYTHFSAHDCFTERSLFLDLTLGLKSALSPGLSFSYLSSISVMSFLWTARDGYLEYPGLETEVWGTGISYEQFWLFLSFGIGLDWTISERITLSGAILVTPLVYAVDQDNHYFRLEQFNETLYGAFGVDPSLALQLSFTERLGALRKLSYRGLWGARGDTAHTEMGTGTLIGIYQNGAGAAYNAVDLSISLISKL